MVFMRIYFCYLILGELTMRLLKFKASDVYGYINFDIEFNKDVSFIVGANGSGKSTLIKLMQCLFLIDFNGLITIPYNRMELEYDEKNVNYRMASSKKDSKLIIELNEEIIEIPILKKDGYIEVDNISDSDYYRHMERNLLSNDSYNKFRSIVPPVFLGLDRKSYGLEPETYGNESNNLRKRQLYLHRKLLNSKDISITGSLAEALVSVQLIIQEQYRKIRDFEDRQAISLRDRILKSSFKFTDFSNDDFNRLDATWENKKDILNRRKEITAAVEKIGSSDKTLILAINGFFDKLEELFNKLTDSNGLSVEWLLNKAQIDRVSDILEVIDSYNAKTARMSKSVNNFLDAINSFLIDSNKRIEVDTVGRLIVSRADNKKCNIDILSSGERQLMVLIANVMLNKYNSVSRVIVIDEPEISLHLKWQEMFSEKILSMNPDTQFILATHSPDIIGELTDKCVKVGG